MWAIWPIAAAASGSPSEVVRLIKPSFTLLQVTPALDAGGVEQTTLDVARAVVRAGGRALVASAGGRMAPELARRGGELIRLPLDRKDPWSLVANACALRRLIAAEGVDIVHARSRAPAWSALWAARRGKVRFVTTYAGVYNARSALKRFYNGVMARGDLVIANSDYTRAHLLREHPVDASKVIAIPRGVDLDRFDPAAVTATRIAAAHAAFGVGAADPRPVLLLAGRLTRWKGQALAVAALAQARAAGVEAVLVCAGDDQGRTGYRSELLAAADAAGLADAVFLPGHVVDMPAAYLAADAVLAPSLDPEAFGRTAVEPQAMGRAVLAAAHGAPCETVIDGETGFLAPPGDVAAWAQAITRLLRLPPDRRAAMGRAGRAHASARYSLDAMTDATLAAYARLLAGEGAA